MRRAIQRILETLGIRKREESLTARQHGNLNAVLAKIRNSTHPRLSTPRRLKIGYVPGERRLGGDWAIRSPWHNGAWILGYYVPGEKLPITVTDPKNPLVYSDATEQHEIAHRCEHDLGIAPPWHFPDWRRFFVGWYGSNPQSGLIPRWFKRPKLEPDDCCCCRVDPAHPLPGCSSGDLVVVDEVVLDRNDKLVTVTPDILTELKA